MKNIETFYPLSPLQKGLLFHSLASPNSGLYFQQMNCFLRGKFDAGAWGKAWQSLVDLHPILRTSFVWEKVQEPIQVVHREVKLQINEQDWRAFNAIEQKAKSAEYLREDRRRGFSVSHAPLMRHALLRMSDDAYMWVWSHHHLLLDGWSVQVLADQIFEFYEGYVKNEPVRLAPSRPYKDYIAWLVHKDLASAERFWRSTLSGFAHANLLSDVRESSLADGNEEEHADETIELSVAETESLQTFARQHQLTLSTLAQAAWALILQRYSGDHDVVFGITVAGRPPELEAVETMVGLFINTQPMRVKIASGQQVVDWLKQIQAQCLAAQAYQYAPLQSVQEWSDLERGKPLFDTLVVFKNYPVRKGVDGTDGKLRVEEVRNYERTNFPLCLVVAVRERTEIQITYDRSRVTAHVARTIVQQLSGILRALGNSAGRSVGELISHFSEGFRLSPQQRDLLRCIESTAAPASRVVTVVEVPRRIDAGALESSCKNVGERYEILRTRCERSGQMRVPLQIVGLNAQVQFDVVDHGECTGDDRAAAMVALASDHCACSDPVRSSFHVTLVDFGHEKSGMILSLQPIYGDIRTARNLVSEILAECRGSIDRNTTEVLQYSSYSEWQNELLGQEAEADGDRYWKALPPTAHAPIPFLKPRSDGISEPVSTEALILDPTLVEQIERAALRFDVSAEVFLLACWALLLSKMSDEPQITIPVVFDGRTDEDLELGIGLFERHLPITVECDGEGNFAAWLKTVESVARSAYQAQSTFEWSRVRQNSSKEDVMTEGCSFRYLDDVDPAQMLEFEGKVIWEKPTTYDFGCELICARRRQGLHLSIAYDRKRIKDEKAFRLLVLFRAVAMEAATNPAATLDSIELCDEAERKKILLNSNPVAVDFDSPAVMTQMLRVLTNGNVSREAVICGRERQTAEQLHARSNQLAHRLIAMGVGPEKLVGISLERSIDMVIAILAVLKAGGAYVPLDPQYPTERLRYMLEDASPRAVLSQTRFRDKLPLTEERLVCLDADSEWAQSPTHDVNVPISPDNLAYVIYTSGTTGRPKGAAISHRALCNHMNWMLREFEFGESDRVLQRTPFSFDASVWEFYAPLLSGGTLVMYSADPHQIPSEVVAAIRKDNITVIQVVPTLLRMLLEDAAFTSCESLRYVFCGGEMLPLEVQKQFSRQLACAQLINLYGPTETCIDATSWNCSESVEASDVPIGTPIANDRLYVMDRHLHLVSPGVRGQLYVSGLGLGRGYWNRPVLTAERFLPDPFSASGGERMYRTGDLGRWTEEIGFHCMGRADNQVKLRGFRIELGEIESVLADHAQARQAVVVYRQEENGNARLSAYVVPVDPAVPPSAAELRAWLQLRLPDYMVPVVFTFLSKLPLLPNGKLDRGALPDPAEVQESASVSLQLPRNAKEQQIADLWKMLLRVSELSIDDNFFEMGGDSILTLQVTARAAEAGLQITPRQIFENPTVESLAAVVEYIRQTQEERPDQEVESGEIPLTPIQRDFFERQYLNQNHYNQAALFRILRPLDRTETEKVFAHLIARHDALRLRFHKNDSGWSQSIEAQERNSVVEFVNDLEYPIMNEAGGIEAMCDRFQASLNIEQGPLLRAAVMERQSEIYLLIVIHHLATDAVSWSIVLEDLITAYDQVNKGVPLELLPPTTSFGKWARKFAAYGQSGALHEEEEYWTATYRSEVNPIPMDFSGKENSESSACTVASVLDAQATGLLLRELPGAYHAQVKEVLLGALAHGLAQWTGDGRLLINMEGHGRESVGEPVDLSRTVGWFTSLVPVYLKVDVSDNPLATLRAVKEQFRTIPSNGLGHGALLHLSGRAEIQRKLSELPQAQICLNYLGQSGPQSSGDSWVIPATQNPGASRHRDAQRIYLLDVQAGIVDGRLHIDWHYSQNIHKQETIEKLSRNVIAALQLLIDLSTSSPEVAFAPSDFPNAQLSQKDLDSLMARISS
ncbi:MAG TPA: amino acid adenylation domain-containing protein [Candidatus Aquilonibacter sp.]|jgi:amino acid adenylation domain-containing protein/non-ribosomal peptide synthase protein (TIGR01720 family)|nr:amino acid adenylation domain-containing protein [Candidatus Aquilonibacter sp.]